MSELSAPSLFEQTPARPPVSASEAPAREEKRSEKLAKEFTRWTFSFGTEFRNSPDLINLRTWAQKNKLKLKDSEEQEVLTEARKLYLKRIEQLIKKSDTPEPAQEFVT